MGDMSRVLGMQISRNRVGGTLTTNCEHYAKAVSVEVRDGGMQPSVHQETGNRAVAK